MGVSMSGSIVARAFIQLLGLLLRWGEKNRETNGKQREKKKDR
jgi:hypothetical protein